MLEAISIAGMFLIGGAIAWRLSNMIFKGRA